MPGNHTEIEKRLWDTADELRANSKLKASEYSVPVLGLIFLRFADYKFTLLEKELAGPRTGRRTIDKADYQARGVMYLPEEARFSKLLNLPEGTNMGKARASELDAAYAEYFGIFADSGHKRHEGMLEWRGQFDPEASDLKAVNRMLR